MIPRTLSIGMALRSGAVGRTMPARSLLQCMLQVRSANKRCKIALTRAPSRHSLLLLMVVACKSPAIAQPVSPLIVQNGSFSGGLGVNFKFDEKYSNDLQAISDVGFNIVRTDLLWANIERRRQHYDWRVSDRLVSRLIEHHLTPLLILDYSNPLYAQSVAGRPATESLSYAAPETGEARAAFMAFASAAIGRYGGGVIWEVWNEPDHNFGSPVDLVSYVGFAREVCHKLRQVRANATVIGPAASGFLWSFLQSFATQTADCFDFISIHPYRDEAPESVLQDWSKARSIPPRCAPPARCPVFVDSEWGYSAYSAAWNERRQADYVVRSRLLDVMAGIPLTIIYDWRNDSPNPTDKESNFGLLNFFNNRKPVFGALRDMTRQLQGLHYLGRVITGAEGDFLVAFGAHGTVRTLVGWTDSERESHITLPTPVCIDTTNAQPSKDDPGRCPQRAFAVPIEGNLKLSSRPIAIPLVQVKTGWSTDKYQAR